MVAVSVIMPMKNAAKFIEQAVTSVLSQTYSNLELIIVDDKSTDNSKAIVARIPDNRIQLINGQGKGIASAFNLALQTATGDYICRCDADDIYPLDRIDHQLKWLQSRPSFGAVCGTYEAVDARGNLVIQFQTGLVEEDITSELLEAKTRTHFCTFLTKKKVLEDLGGCRSFFKTAEDIDLQLRMAEVTKIGYVPHNYYQYRIHNTSITHTQSSAQRIFFEKLARSFQKERSLNGRDALQNGTPPDIPIEDGLRKTGNQHIAGFLVTMSWRLHKKGQKWEAIKIGLKACINHPLDYLIWRNLLILVIKKSGSHQKK